MTNSPSPITPELITATEQEIIDIITFGDSTEAFEYLIKVIKRQDLCMKLNPELLDKLSYIAEQEQEYMSKNAEPDPTDKTIDSASPSTAQPSPHVEPESITHPIAEKDPQPIGKIGNKNAQKTGYFSADALKKYVETDLYKEILQGIQTDYDSLTRFVDQICMEDMALLKVKIAHLWEAKEAYLKTHRIKKILCPDLLIDSVGIPMKLTIDISEALIDAKQMTEEERHERVTHYEGHVARWEEKLMATACEYDGHLKYYGDQTTLKDNRLYDHKKKSLKSRLDRVAERVAEYKNYREIYRYAPNIWHYLETLQTANTPHWKQFEREEAILQKAYETKKRLLDQSNKQKRQEMRVFLSFSKMLLKQFKHPHMRDQMAKITAGIEVYWQELLPAPLPHRA